MCLAATIITWMRDPYLHDMGGYAGRVFERQAVTNSGDTGMSQAPHPDAAAVVVDLRKWPDSPHWRYRSYLLGTDHHGAWLYIPSTATAQKGEDEPRPVRSAFVTLVNTTRWWTANFYIGHPFLSVYVNISTPPQLGDRRLTAIDLDLDVMRDLDGQVRILDQDEIALHRRTLGYPPDLVSKAQKAADLAQHHVTDGIEPFGVAAKPWLAQAADFEQCTKT